jgi:hypothetical protein
MSSAIPTTYASIELRSERLGELQQCLMAHGFALTWIEDEKQERLAIEDEPRAEDAGENI